MIDEGDTSPRWLGMAPPAARRAGDLVFAGGDGLFAATDIDALRTPNVLFPHHDNPTERQLRYGYDRLEKALVASGSSMAQVLTINAFHRDPAGIDAALKLRGQVFPHDGPPASTLLLTPAMPGKGAVVATDVIALADTADIGRSHILRSSQASPLPVLGSLYGRPVFSQLIRGGGLIFTQGKGITAGPALGSANRPQDVWRVEAQTELTLDYLADLLSDVGASLEHVVRAEITLNDPADMVGLDRVWRRRFPQNPPARVVLPTRLALADCVVVEISLIAVDPDGPLRPEPVTAAGVAALGWETPAVRAGPYVFLSSRMATDATGRVIVAASPFVGALAVEEAERIADDIARLCEAAGGGLQDIVQRRSFISDLSACAAAESVWRGRCAGPGPVTTILGAGPMIAPGCTQVADVIAWIP